MFSKILIANRSEIAVRIIRACKEMGISTVAVYSEADRDALHVSLADESCCIGPAAVRDSYLNIPAILTAAKVYGAQAIHPGYGLLSENARFAELTAQQGMAFIGAPAKVISAMGDKDAARRTMKAAGVPVIEGSGLIGDEAALLAEAERIGLPLMIKARAGGGGRGIRIVREKEELLPAWRSAFAEAQAAFGDGACYLEKYLTSVKHVEMQILADGEGNVVCLGERDCSMQRRNQKLLEESPSPAVDGALRERMSQCCVRAARAAGYLGAGTIEFLLDQATGEFYFMEMNTRLQVEHPVTEMVTGVDLVKWQIRIAAGLPLDFSQKDVQLRGHAIECRINAENPMEGFCPSCGRIPQVRFDTALYQEYVIPPFYDSMIGKLIVSAKTREEAIRKMQAALCELVIEGVEHTGEFQTELISQPEFRRGTYTTGFLTQWMGS